MAGPPRLIGACVAACVACLMSLGCGPDNAQEFEAQAGALVCAFNQTCPDGASIPIYPYPEDETCEATFAMERAVCTTGTCEFNRRQAKRCIKRLEDSLSSCDDDRSHRPCQKVYDCNVDGSPCDIYRPGCACRSNDVAPPWSGLAALVGLVAWRRRRRSPLKG